MRAISSSRMFLQIASFVLFLVVAGAAIAADAPANVAGTWSVEVSDGSLQV